ncbi:MAG: alpha/beta hydrolase [Burkholderiaceae bacterium]
MELSVRGFEAKAYAYTGGKDFDSTLPCVVFVHGALHDHSVWTLLARWYAHHGHGVLAVDQPGHGRSGGAPLASVEALADWLLALLEAAGVSHASLVGHSMGSLIALEAAARAPTKIDALVMLGTAYPMKVSEALLETARSAPLKAIDMVNVFSHSTIAAKPSHPGPGTWLHGANRALMRRVQAGQTAVNLFHHDFGVCDRYAAGLEAAAKVHCPVAMILGERDQMTAPKQSREIALALKARVHAVAAGHSLMSEAPDAVLAALREALPRPR